MSIVSIERCSEYDLEEVKAALERTFDNLGGVEKYIKPGMKVVLKPNLVSKRQSKEAATTHPALVHALTLIIKKAGATVAIAESPFGGYNESALRTVYNVCGMEKVAQEAGIELNYDLGEVDVGNPEGLLLKKVTILKPLAEADLIINLPKLKTHGQMTYTGAVKNMFGAVPGVLKAEYHLRMPNYDDFANAIIDVFLSAKPTLNIMDAVVGMDGNGPTAGNPKHIGLILASANAFELDFTALQIIDANVDDVPVIKQAIVRKLCPQSIRELEVKGESIESVRIKGFIIPGKDAMRVIRIYNKGFLKPVVSMLKPKPVIEHELCVGCSECEKGCPARIIKMSDKKKAKINLNGCIRCFCCQEICPAKAIEIKRPILSKFLIKKSKKV